MSKAKIAVIGAGNWATDNHIPVLKSRPDAEITGICALRMEKVRKVQEDFNIPFGTEDYLELLSREKLGSPDRGHIPALFTRMAVTNW